MSYYVYAPAGTSDNKQDERLMKCVEYIGSKQKGSGSNYAKGRTYLKKELKKQGIDCSGTAIKRAIVKKRKIKRHDYETYGLYVYYYHIDWCAVVIYEIIKYIVTNCSEDKMKELLGAVPKPNNAKNDGIKLVYFHRMRSLKWVYDYDYKEQDELALYTWKKFENSFPSLFEYLELRI